MDVDACICCAWVCEDAGLHLQALRLRYMFSMCHELSSRNPQTGYFCERVVSNLIASQVSADKTKTLSCTWMNALEESW